MAYEGYATLRVASQDGIAWATIDHPPINLLDMAMAADLGRLVGEVGADEGVKVLVVRSANPDFFIAHADVGMLQQLPTEPPPRSEELGPYHQIVEAVRTLPKATIGVVEGAARGGGSEVLLSLDMRFGALGRARVGQPEAAMGLTPGAGGTQRLPRLIGRGRALEMLLGAGDLSAEIAERYGYLNRAMDPDELIPFVEGLARRIASFPAEAIVRIKAAVDAAEPSPVPGLLDEADLFAHAVAEPETRRRMARFLDLGGQTPEAESGDLTESLLGLADS